MTDWTLGPWKWFETEDGVARVNPASGGLLVAECSVRNPSDVEQRANARLIAAAPDLYEALAECLEGIELCTLESPGRFDAALNRARAALSKARGEHG